MRCPMCRQGKLLLCVLSQGGEPEKVYVCDCIRCFRWFGSCVFLEFDGPMTVLMKSVYRDCVAREHFLSGLLASAERPARALDVDAEHAEDSLEERIWGFVERETGLETPQIIEIPQGFYAMHVLNRGGFIVKLVAKSREELARDYWHFRFVEAVEAYELVTRLWRRRTFWRQRRTIIAQYHRWVVWRERNLSDEAQHPS